MANSNGNVAPAARVRDAVKIFGTGDTEVRALDGLSVEFPVGQFTAVMGPSGSGKSTLMQCMAGLDSLTSGSIELAGRELGGMSERELTRMRREQVGFVFQSFNLVPTLTLGENVELPMRLAGESADPAWRREVIDRLGIGDRLRHRPAELSGGQQQRGAVARALLPRPAIIFADEPTGNLDSHSSAEMLELMRSVVHDLGQTIVMVTHDPAAAAWADRVLYLVDGKIVREETSPTRESVLESMRAITPESMPTTATAT